MLAWLGQISAPQRAVWLLLLCPSHLENPKIDPDIQQVFRYTKIASHQEMAIIPHTFLFLYFLRVLYCHWVSQWRPVCFLVWSGHFLWSCSLYLQPLYDCVFLGPWLPILPQKCVCIHVSPSRPASLWQDPALQYFILAWTNSEHWFRTCKAEKKLQKQLSM